ncbi:DUF2157 domain-containing protein [Armatimonas rosea]|uniref:Putative membrane protein n=1 Tax=Armatimonas rosea TaxID=685828 RepID=A0A7W9SQ51_ARMRO|nr:DUF2157 domain-containing protein [Armatimonas rosea]MBB6050139.1 putative membrane protein [Armatimonas rosea]
MKESEFVRRLQLEVEHWHDEGLVDAALAERLLARYDGQDGPARSRLAVALSFLGALLIGIGMIVFVASNWAVIPGAAKLGGLLVAMVLAYGGGFRLRYVGESYHGTGNALLFLGVLLYGANVFLVAQAMHINAEAPSLLVLWAVGVLPLGWLLESRAMLGLGLILLTVALGGEAAFWYDSPGGFCAVSLLWGTLLVALGRLVPRLAGLAGLGAFVVLATLTLLADFGLSFYSSPSAEWAYLAPGGKLRLVLLGAVTLATTLALLFRRGQEPLERGEGLVLLALAVLAGGLLVGGGIDEALLRTGFNILLLLVILGVLWVGYERREPGWVQLALAFFALEVLSRYVELLWERLPMEIFFLSAGVVLLGGGLALERMRRTLLKKLAERE